MKNEYNGGIRVIITGATGMVGEGVMHVCLENDAVESVLLLNRKSSGVSHPKLTEVIHSDFHNLSAIREKLKGYNACFFCLGVSSVGMSAENYYHITYSLTMHVAKTLSELNQDMTLCYVSGQGTDSSEKGRSAWARVKGKTENDLMKLPFKQVFAFRPGFIKPIKGLSLTHKYYKYITWLFPIGRFLYSNGFVKLEEVANAMMEVTLHGFGKAVVEGNDIIALSKRR